MMTALLYVSRSNLKLPAEAGEVEAVVAMSRHRNARLGVTGALVFTERHFAQYLEGPAAGLEELMNSIGGDPRHRDVQLVYREEVPARRFDTWALAYAGPSTFVAGNVLPLTDPLAEAPRRKAALRLIDLMRQFVEAHLAAERRNRNG